MCGWHPFSKAAKLCRRPSGFALSPYVSRATVMGRLGRSGKWSDKSPVQRIRQCVGADFDLDQTNQSISIKEIEGYMYVSQHRPLA